MSDAVVITLIVVIAILIVLYLYREKLHSFFFEGGGLKTGLKTHKPAPAVRRPAETPAAPPAVGARLEAGNVEDAQVYNAGAGSNAELKVKDVKGSTVINTRGDINMSPPSQG
jgi:hypothetical protein